LAELWFHALFLEQRVRGEWFDLPPIALKWIRSLQSWPAAECFHRKSKASTVKQHAAGFAASLFKEWER
jgi:hypothetical protein